MEAEQYQTASHQLESEGSNLRLEVMTKDSELRRYRDKNENLEREIQEVHFYFISFMISNLFFVLFFLFLF